MIGWLNTEIFSTNRHKETVGSSDDETYYVQITIFARGVGKECASDPVSPSLRANSSLAGELLR